MKRILNFGSLNIDYVYKLEHFVRPGETISSDSLTLFCGGKGLNQSIALARAGADVYHAGCVGLDDGRILLDELKKAGVDTKHVRQVTTKSGSAIIQVDNCGENAIILFGGANRCVDEDQIDATLSCFESGDILLLQNEISNIAAIMKRAAEKGMIIAINPSPFDENARQLPLHLANVLLLNEIESMDILQSVKMDSYQMLAALHEKFPEAKIILTLGKHGVLYFDGDSEHFQPSFPVQAVDTTAAGDTFTGFFLAGFAEGLPTQKILERATGAAALSVCRTGAASSIPTIDEVMSFITTIN